MSLCTKRPAITLLSTMWLRDKSELNSREKSEPKSRYDELDLRARPPGPPLEKSVPSNST